MPEPLAFPWGVNGVEAQAMLFGFTDFFLESEHRITEDSLHLLGLESSNMGTGPLKYILIMLLYP